MYVTTLAVLFLIKLTKKTLYYTPILSIPQVYLRPLSLINPFITISLSIPLSPPPLSPYLPLYHVYLHTYPSILSIYSIFHLLSYLSDPSVSIPLSILPLFPYLSLYLFYLYIYPSSIYSSSITTSIPLSLLQSTSISKYIHV